MKLEPLQERPIRQRSWLLIALSVIISVAVVIGAASNFLTFANPSLALAINPLNTTARIGLLSSKFQANNEPEELKQLNEIALNGLEFDPIVARLYSLLGLIKERQGNPAAAQPLYQHSLKLLPSEIHALTRRFANNLYTANYVKAVTQADLILRRWPGRWKDIKSVMPALLQNKAAYDQARNLFARHQNGKYRLIASLSEDVASTVIARRLIKDWHSEKIDDLHSASNHLTNKLISHREYINAYRIFLLTLNDDEKKAVGYIYNSDFDLKPTGNRFDWQVPKQAGITAGFRRFAASNATGNKPDNTLALQFLDAPVRFSKTLQNLLLPSSKFTLKLTYSTSALKTKKPIKLQVMCRKKGKELTTLSFEPGNNNKKNVEVTFQVPTNDCELQQLRIFNDNSVQSWKNRYSGTLFIHHVSISLTGA